MKYIVALALLLGIANEGLCGIKNAEAFWADRPAKDSNTAILVTLLQHNPVGGIVRSVC